MKTVFHRLAKRYFFSAWLPSAVALLLLGLLIINWLVLPIPYVDFILLFALAVSLLGILASAVIQLNKGRKAHGVINLLAFCAIGIAIALGMSFAVFQLMFNDTPDNFGKDIVIPAGMKVSDPVEKFAEPRRPAADALTEKVVAAFTSQTAASGSATVSTDLEVLNEFSTANRQKLIEYLAASPQWFVTEERGKPYAYRRLAVGGQWQNALNGFYTSTRVAPSIQPLFQTRIVIGFDGPVFVEPFRKIQTTAKVGSGDVAIRVVADKRFDQGRESYFVLEGSRAVVEIFEQSSLDARPATLLALADLRHELETALRSTGAVSEKSSVVIGESEIQLAKGVQGGIYQVRALVNAGESGRVYLKVFEATKNTPLSAKTIGGRSIARLGWSASPKEKFLYLSEVIVYEGDWGNFYPGRFELWFIPDSGQPERKLVDRIFRIEGWMR